MYICDIMLSVYSDIETKVRKVRPGQIFIPSDFKDLGTSTAIRKALSRLVEKELLVRMGQGIYVKPLYDKIFGLVLPSLEDIAVVLANKDRVIIKPTGQYALNKLGLSTQVPTNIVFLTNGTKKKIKIGKNTINFLPTTTKKIAMIGPISSLLFLGLEDLELKLLSELEMHKIISLLRQEDVKKLSHDLKLTSSKISDFVIKNLKNKENVRLDSKS